MLVVMPPTQQTTNHVDWIVTSRPHFGEIVSGDDCAVIAISEGVLCVVVDGLGHGPQAADAAQAAIADVRAHSELPIEAIFAHCHAQIRGTRGVAMTVARVSKARKNIQWFGIGNVECFLVSAAGRPRESAPLRGGIVGYQLPAPRSTVVPYTSGDVLVWATDGLRSQFNEHLSCIGPLEKIAEQLLMQFGKNNDDALVLVARLNEGGP